MSFSPLTTKIIPASTSNYSKGRSGQTIKKITWHHMAGNCSIETCGSFWQNPSRRASSNYGIGSDGRIGGYVDEENRSWCSSSAANDNQAITIEIANDGGAPDWHVSDKAIESAINLTVDICKRRGIKKLVWTGDANGTFTWHCFFTSTSCPGPYLKGKTPWAVDQINQRLADSDKPTLTWTKLDKPEIWITRLNPTNLWDFNHTTMNACKSVKQYKSGEEIVIYGKVFNKQLGATYLLTEYSYTNGITNGFNEWDMTKKIEPEPAPEPKPDPKPEWSDIESTIYEANGEINLYDIVTNKVVSSYKNGTEITVVQKTTWNGVEYVRTEWSKEKSLNNGFKLSDLKKPEPTPEPEPEPTPTPEPDPTVGILQKIIQFVQHIIDLITGKEKK